MSGIGSTSRQTRMLQRPSGTFAAIRQMPTEKKMLIFSLIAIAILSAYRTYHYWLTGFYVSDEFGYAYDAMHGTVYGTRWFFGYLNILLFDLLHVTNATSFAILLPFYLFIWSSTTIVTFYLIMKELSFNQRTVTISLVSSFFLISFVLLSLGFLTETVGLALSMVGIFWLLKYAHSSAKTSHFLIVPFLAALFFAAASGTREPYYIFLMVGDVMVTIIAVSCRSQLLRFSSPRRWALIIFSIMLFAIPSTYFLKYPNDVLTGQIGPVSIDFIQALLGRTPVPVVPPSILSTFTQIAVSTSTYTQTITNVVNGTTTPSIVTVTNSTTFILTHTSSTTAATAGPLFPLLQNKVINTIVIFVGGMILGWGPILFVIGLIGELLLISRFFKRKGTTNVILLLITLSALGSYFIVSYIFSPDPSYFSLRNYSTILRFSDTALPAYFLAAPFSLSLLVKTRRRAITFVAILLAFSLAVIPLYEGYAASNLSYAAGDPFQLNYRSPAAQVRDYLGSHPGLGAVYIVGVPFGWLLTPGTDRLQDVRVYSFVPSPAFAYLSQTNFTKSKWTTFYIYASSDYSDLKTNAPYLYQIVGGATNNSTAMPFTVVARQILIRDSGFVFVKIQLSWT